MQLQSQIMRGKYADTYRRAGRNVRRQHPYAGSNKHANKTAKYKPTNKGTVRDVSLRQTHVHSTSVLHTPKPKPTPYSRQGKPNKTKADLAATF